MDGIYWVFVFYSHYYIYIYTVWLEVFGELIITLVCRSFPNFYYKVFFTMHDNVHKLEVIITEKRD